MEQEIWDAVDDVARRRCILVTELVSEIDRQRGEASLTAELRVYVLGYYRKVIERLDSYGMTRVPLARPIEQPAEYATLQ
ncbi:putative DNA-binding ribbon-helix-helix protein [Azospirillum agricola]|nr:putative DNA-binding ribbon-helix-helix protein [Azospirillum agricola]SMH59042.1 Ribbon-helix-helix domain-containing protein [Azospirillum lipoferum]